MLVTYLLLALKYKKVTNRYFALPTYPLARLSSIGYGTTKGNYQLSLMYPNKFEDLLLNMLCNLRGETQLTDHHLKFQPSPNFKNTIH